MFNGGNPDFPNPKSVVGALNKGNHECEAGEGALADG